MSNIEYKVCKHNPDLAIGSDGIVKRTNPFTIYKFKSEYPKGLLKPDGYHMHMIHKKWHYTHRLVAEHFIPNPKKLSDVNHKNGIKSDNRVENLEWMSHSDNIRHSYTALGRTTPKGEAHWLYGKKASDETKAKMSAAKKGLSRKGKSGRWVKDNPSKEV